MAVKNDSTYMLRAFTLAQRGRGATSPNPMVGAVIVRGGRIIGEGYHRNAGAPHAEILALARAGEKARGATLFVTLEPCCHTGRTGPCTTAIIEAGIRRVVYAVGDPDPRVSGRGASALRKAGVAVTGGVLATESRLLNEYYFFSQKHKRPFVILKLAQSLDGRIAARTGDSKWISGKKSRKFVHQLRSEIDAVVVGAETVRRDNPKLTVRAIKGRSPYRIVLAGKRPLPLRSEIFKKNSDAKTIVAYPRSMNRSSTIVQLRKSKVELWSIVGSSDGVDVRRLVGAAQKRGFRSLLLEGGSALASSFMIAGLVDKVILFTAPIVIGAGPSSFVDLETTSLAKAVRFERVSRFDMGEDSVFVGYPAWRRK